MATGAHQRSSTGNAPSSTECLCLGWKKSNTTVRRSKGALDASGKGCPSGEGGPIQRPVTVGEVKHVESPATAAEVDLKQRLHSGDRALDATNSGTN